MNISESSFTKAKSASSCKEKENPNELYIGQDYFDWLCHVPHIPSMRFGHY